MKNKTSLKWLFLVIGSIFYLFLNGKHNVGISAWIWTFTILYFYRNCDKKIEKFFVLLLMMILTSVKWYGMLDDSFAVEVCAGLALGFIFFVPFIVDSIFYKRLSGIKKLLVFPLSFASIEFIMSVLPISTLDSLAVTQTNNISFIQLASLIGIYGISFLIALFASVFVFVIDYYENNRKILAKPLVIYGIIIALVFTYGGLRISFANTNDSSIKIATTTGMFLGKDVYNVPDVEVDKTINYMKKKVIDAKEKGAEILIYSEEGLIFNDVDKERVLNELKSSARENNIFILAPVEIDSTKKKLNENKYYLFDNYGNIVMEYTKAKLVPIIETSEMKKGTGKIPNKTITLPSGKKVKLSAVICMDGSFPAFIRDGVDNDTELLIIPSWDWDAISEYHNNSLKFRSVENGIVTVRVTYNGYSGAFDVYGRVISLFHTDSIGFEKVTTFDIPINSEFSLYKYIGFIIDWLYPLGLIIIIITSKRRKSNS